MSNSKLFNLEKVDGLYQVQNDLLTEEQVIEMAKSLLAARVCKGTAYTNPELFADYLVCNYSNLEHEVFGMIMLDNQHRIIKVAELFRGTINTAAIFPREIVKEVLNCNSAAVAIFHNHPSGCCTPSDSDHAVTRKIKRTLDLVDVKVLDHFVVGGGDWTSFAEKGYL